RWRGEYATDAFFDLPSDYGGIGSGDLPLMHGCQKRLNTRIGVILSQERSVFMRNAADVMAQKKIVYRCFVATLVTFMLAGGAGVTRAAEPAAVESSTSVLGAASPFIDRANKEWEAAIQMGDADALSRPYSEDAVFIGPDANPVRGRAAIRAMYAARAAAKKRIAA